MTLQFDRRFPSLEVALVIGDAVHAVRSGLDHAACALVEAGGGQITRDTAFPIPRNSTLPANWQSMVQTALRGAQQSVIDVVLTLEPFPDGVDEILWATHYLDIVDKHRVPIVAAVAHRAVVINIGAHLQALRPESELPDALIARRPADGFPVVHGTVLYNAPRDVIEREQPQFEFGAALDEPALLRGVDINDTLKEIHEKAAEIVERLADAALGKLSEGTAPHTITGTELARRMGTTVSQMRADAAAAGVRPRVLVIPHANGSGWTVHCETCGPVDVGEGADRDEATANAALHRTRDHGGGGAVNVLGGPRL